MTTALPHQPHHPDNQRRYQGEKEISYEASYRLRGNDFLAGFCCARFSGSSVLRSPGVGLILLTILASPESAP